MKVKVRFAGPGIEPARIGFESLKKKLEKRGEHICTK